MFFRRMTSFDASLIKGMIARGDTREEIASTLGIAKWRLAGVIGGDKFPNSAVATQEKLPEKKQITVTTVQVD